MAAAVGAIQHSQGEGGGRTLINIKQAANLLLPINKTFALGDFRRNFRKNFLEIVRSVRVGF